MPDFELNFNNDDYSVIANTESGTFGSEGDYIRVTILDQNSNIITLNDGTSAIFYSGSSDLALDIPGRASNHTTVVPQNQFESYYDPANNLYLKPNEILAANSLPQGNYKLQVDFLNQYQPIDGSDVFVVKQISPSRLEVRLKLLDNPTAITKTDDNDVMSSFKTHLGDTYTFNHILYIGEGKNIPVVNYQFDKFTDGENNQSIILKLYEPLPSSVKKLDVVTVEREVLITQTQDVYYMSSVITGQGGGYLSIDSSNNWTNQQGSDDVTWQSYDNLTGSLSDLSTINNLISGSSFDYPNLNIDYNSFSNHTFFGSAVKKLENFKTKVSTIEDYYSEISSSLSADGSAIGGDPTSVKNRRKYLFDKIQDEINSFTPYEKFLYYDGQSQSTSSAPSLGDNYADTVPVNTDELTTLINYDGFNVVYKHSNELADDQCIGLFLGKHRIENKPFFNYSGSVYLSFILKGDESISDGTGTPGLRWTNSNQHGHNGNVILPQDAFGGTNKLQNPSITGSEYRRFIYKTSQSYWQPTEEVYYNTSNITEWGTGSTQYEILSGSIKTGSNAIRVHGSYQDLATVITQSEVSFSGSIMPAGELFRIWYESGSAVTSSYMTDVKVTFNDPTDTLPFSYMYQTGSSTFNDWYTGLHSSASAYDDTNIHSLINNLPTYIQESNDYDELKTFLNMNGEHFDLIRNHIDNYTSVYNRGYNKLDSVPTNLIPMLADNLGWELITPFTGSLSDYFGSSVSSVTTTDDIRHNTWRKSLNNLIYLYKSKGTKNAVRALLNIYGYPPDVIGISEFGGSSEEQEQLTTADDLNSMVDGLGRKTDNVSFVLRKKKLYNYNFNANTDRILNLDWWMNNADANSLEFIYKHRDTTNNQEILKSSGSGTETLWDLRLLPSGDGLSSSFEFRLNNSRTGSLAIGSNTVSMSTSYNKITEGSLWNILLQRMTASISGSGVQEYRLATALQNKDKISILSAVSMSVSGGVTRDSNYNANENWQSSGSRHQLSSSNLFVGRTLSGSLAEFRTWTTTLSASKFKQHTLNKFSTVGNNSTAHKDDLIYHYKLNENWNATGSDGIINTNPIIYDSNPKGPSSNPTNYDITLSADVITGSLLYGYDVTDVYTFTLRTDSYNQEDDNKILINPTRTFTGHNLNPFQPSIKPLSAEKSRASRINSSKLEISNSPTNFINDFIVNNITDTDLLKLYTKPADRYSSSYTELDTFRDNFFSNYDITINTNKFIRAHENIWNQSAIEAIKKVVPARSTLSDSSVGVTIKPHLLERQKVEKKKSRLQYGETGLFSSELNGKAADLSKEIDIKSRIDLTETYEPSKDGTIDINEKTSLSETSYEDTKNTEINIDNTITETSTYDATKNTEIDIDSNIVKDFSYDKTKDSEINIDNEITKEMSYEVTKDTEIDGLLTITEEMENNVTKDTEIDGLLTITEEMENNVTKNAEFSPLPIFNSEHISTKDSNDVDYHSTNWIKDFRDLHKEWGTGSADTHFLNLASDDSGSLGDGNVGHIDNRFVFRMIGDVEVLSASFRTTKGYNPNLNIDFTNHKNHLNREIRDKGKGYTYNSYINGNPGVQDGRPVGKTSYYTSSADGQLLFPSNHWSKFDRPFTDRLYEGTLNTNPGFLNLRDVEDYSSASFYSVEVAFEHGIRVERGKLEKGKDNI